MMAKRRVAPKRKQRAHDSFPKVHPDKWEWYAGSFGNGFDSATVNYSGILTVSFYRTPTGLLNRYVRYDFEKLGKYYSALRDLQWKLTEDPGRSKGAPSSNMTPERGGSLGDIDGEYSDFCGLLSPGLLCGNIINVQVSDSSGSNPTLTVAGIPVGTVNMIHTEEEACGSHDFKCAKCGAAKGRDIWAGSAYCLPGIVTADTEQREALLKFWLAWARAHSAGLEYRGANLAPTITPEQIRTLADTFREAKREAAIYWKIGKSTNWNWPAALSEVAAYYYSHKNHHYTGQGGTPAGGYQHPPEILSVVRAVLVPDRVELVCRPIAPASYALGVAWAKCKAMGSPIKSPLTLRDHIRRLK